MKLPLYTALCAAALTLAAGAASADPWKDESGKGQWRGSYGWQGDGYAPRRHRQAGRIPPGHLPPPGECRVWRPGVPPGHQPPPFRC
jgi:hypothetical protein